MTFITEPFYNGEKKTNKRFAVDNKKTPFITESFHNREKNKTKHS